MANCPHCAGPLTSGQDQFQDAWICPACNREVQPVEAPRTPEPSSTQSERDALLAQVTNCRRPERKASMTTSTAGAGGIGRRTRACACNQERTA